MSDVNDSFVREKPFDAVSNTINASISQYDSNPDLNTTHHSDEFNELYNEAIAGDKIATIDKMRELTKHVEKDTESFNSDITFRIDKEIKSKAKMSTESNNVVSSVSSMGWTALIAWVSILVKDNIIPYCNLLFDNDSKLIDSLSSSKLASSAPKIDIPDTSKMKKIYLKDLFERYNLSSTEITTSATTIESRLNNAIASFTLIKDDKDYLNRYSSRMQEFSSYFDILYDFVSKTGLSDTSKKFKASDLTKVAGKVGDIYDKLNSKNLTYPNDIFVWSKANYSIDVLFANLKYLDKDMPIQDGITKLSHDSVTVPSYTIEKDDVVYSTIKCLCSDIIEPGISNSQVYGSSEEKPTDKGSKTLLSLSGDLTCEEFYKKVELFYSATENYKSLADSNIVYLMSSLKKMSDMLKRTAATMFAAIKSYDKASLVEKQGMYRLYISLMLYTVSDVLSTLDSLHTIISKDMLIKLYLYDDTCKLIALLNKIINNDSTEN